MGKVRIVTDSTADMDEGEAARLGIAVVPLNVHWNGDTYLDKVELTIDEFYRKLREEKGTPKTSQPSVGRFEEVYRQLLEEADGVVSVHISGKVSGTINAARVAAANVAPDRIALIDSMILAYPLGTLALRLARLAQSGATLEECRATGEEIVPRLRLFAGMDTLEFLRRGGRLGRAQFFAGTLLSIKPIVHLVEGEILPADRVRTRSAAVRRMAELMVGLGPMEEAAVLYGDDPTPADELQRLLEEMAPGLMIKRGRTGAVLGSHTGPGVFAGCAVLAR